MLGVGELGMGPYLNPQNTLKVFKNDQDRIRTHDIRFRKPASCTIYRIMTKYGGGGGEGRYLNPKNTLKVFKK